MTREAYNECVLSYADLVYRFALKATRNEADAEDIVQTAFEKLWRNREKVASDSSKSYLFTVVYHQIIDHFKKNGRIVSKDDINENESIVDFKNDHDVKRILNNAIYRLSEVQRSLILLKDYEGYSYQEIAVITSLSLSQVRVYLHRARLQLRNYLVKPENVI